MFFRCMTTGAFDLMIARAHTQVRLLCMHRHSRDDAAVLGDCTHSHRHTFELISTRFDHAASALSAIATRMNEWVTHSHACMHACALEYWWGVER